VYEKRVTGVFAFVTGSGKWKFSAFYAANCSQFPFPQSGIVGIGVLYIIERW
jgi:hypothetical protein